MSAPLTNAPMQTLPDSPDELFSLASQLHAAMRLDETKAVLQRLLEIAPAHIGGLNLLGIAIGQSGDPAAGADYVDRALALGGDQPIFLRNLCELRRQASDPQAAVAAGRRAVALAPDDLIARLNLAMAEQDALDLAAARANADAVLEAEPDNGSAHFLRAHLSLLQGDFPGAWDDYAWRWRIAGAELPRPRRDIADWDGGAIDGELLLIADQGFGDIIQFARYLPWARGRCARLLICCPLELRGLLRRLVPDAAFTLDLNQSEEAQASSVFSTLPVLAGTTLDTVPSPEPYLRADPARVTRWTIRLDQLAPPSNRRIGIVWAGRRDHRADRQRSMPLATFAPLFNRPATTFVSVQKGEPVGQIGAYFGPAPLVNLGPELEDFDDTAGVLSALDGLITVDTSVAHLAGALGCPVQVLLPYRPDWRWLLDRADSPWYASVRLWRDATPTSRAETVRALAQSLE